MRKPKHLYHGSRQAMGLLKPSQGVGYGKVDGQYGVYAVADSALAIPFAISYRPTGENAIFSVDTSSSPPRILLQNAEVEWDKTGYLYTVRSDLFEQVDGEQWVAREPVAPVWVEKVHPQNYREWVEYRAGN